MNTYSQDNNKLDSQQIKLGLERINNAIKSIHEPCKHIPAIQIVGTNGKGSIASFLGSIVKEASIKTGITTSPHLIYWNERIRINNQIISKDLFDQKVKSLERIKQESNLSTFEFITLIALDYFNSQEVELLVLEAGLGGRLDATTAHNLRPIIAIASIGLDHCEYLGNSLQEIAYEKGSVITENSHVISCSQHPEVIKIFKKISQERNASFNLVKPISKRWQLGLKGNYQR